MCEAGLVRPHHIVDVRYLLVLNAGLYQAPDGSYWADPSWIKDLGRHLSYLPKLTLIGPVPRIQPGADMHRLPDSPMRVVPCARGFGRLWFFASLPWLILTLLREVPRSYIVHTGVAGYPFPVGWIAIPIARLFSKKVVLTVESSFWRIPAGARVGLAKRLNAAMWEAMTRWCLRQASYAAYPHEDYRRSLPSPRAGGGVLFQASWIDDEQILSRVEVESRWSARIASGTRPRFVFAARMVAEKGTRILAEAIRLLAADGVDVDVDIIGSGRERDIFLELQDMALGGGRVRLLDPIDYGPAFFAFLRGYDAVLAPGLTDEQPRIVYDAASQGVGAIVSDLAGLRACVEKGRTGRFVTPGDPRALADAIAAADLPTCRDWGVAARDRATGFTHGRMHDDRARDLQRLLPA